MNRRILSVAAILISSMTFAACGDGPGVCDPDAPTVKVKVGIDPNCNQSVAARLHWEIDGGCLAEGQVSERDVDDAVGFEQWEVAANERYVVRFGRSGQPGEVIGEATFDVGESDTTIVVSCE